MSHRKVRKILNAYLDRELEEKDRRLVEEHLKDCEECSREFEVLKAVDQMTRASVARPPSEDYWKTLPGRVRTRIILEEEKSKAAGLKNAFILRPAPLKLIATLAVLALVVLIGRQYVMEEGPGFVKMERLPDEDVLPAPAAPELSDIESRAELAGEPPADEMLKAGEATRPERETTEEAVMSRREKAPAGVRDDVVPAEAERAVPSKPAGVPKEKTDAYGYETAAKKAAPKTALDKSTMPEETREAISGSTRLELARSQHSRGEYDEAIRNYSLVIDEDTNLAPPAQFELNMVQSAVRDTGSDEATLRRRTESWQSFVQEYPKSELVAEAYRNLADNAYALSTLTRKKDDIEQAIAATRTYLRLVRGGRTAEVYNRQLNELERDLKKVK